MPTPPIHPRRMPSLVYANRNGEITDFPELDMAARSGSLYQLPDLQDLIPLPEGSELFVLPGRKPVGFEPDSNEPSMLAENPEDPADGIQAVAAFMAPAHTAIHTAAFVKDDDAVTLPLFAYTAVGWLDGRFWVSGFRSDDDLRQEPKGFDPDKIRSCTQKRLQNLPQNRLVQHLGTCSLTYSCPAAKNYFLDRYEAPLPTSPECNARCIGCISLQPSGCCPSTQERIRFIPSANEIAEVAIPHLQRVENGVVSFGQGCEGEPLLQAKLIEKAIRLIRQTTDRGTVNLNSNASLPDAVARLAKAGLDSIRVSMVSARPEYHLRYYRPKGFTFNDVRQSISTMKNAGKFVSLNYFILPGFTDDPEEFAALCELVETEKPDFIQLRNLNMDPDWYFESVQHTPTAPPMGIRLWHSELQKKFPKLRFGYFNPPLH
ncbi:MAG: radical SAM protein [Desulfobulbaceae bacterium]|nr:radical SAM protein [Desulfobulbaceae bacterium]